jgi:hypothetical protein
VVVGVWVVVGGAVLGVGDGVVRVQNARDGR